MCLCVCVEQFSWYRMFSLLYQVEGNRVKLACSALLQVPEGL